MNLIIDNSQNKVRKSFIEFLIKKTQEYTSKFIENKKYESMDVYLKSTLDSDRIVTTKEIILSGIYNLKYLKYSDKYIIQIDENQILYGTDYHLEDICKLVNYGNLEISGTHIFSNIFTYIQQNLQVYYQIYLKYS